MSVSISSRCSQDAGVLHSTIALGLRKSTGATAFTQPFAHRWSMP
jgi:hypothetical protein